MELMWEALTIDTRDPSTCARWWAETLGWDVASKASGGVEVRQVDGRGPSLFFVPSREGKTIKNRLHLDLYAEDQAAAVERLEARGAQRVDIGQGEDTDLVVLRDPEGNEFCLLEPRFAPAGDGERPDVATGTWDERIDAFWSTADDSQPERTLARMATLVVEKPVGDADASFELASVHDYLGRESEAVPLYRSALRDGLAGERRSQAVVQLASSLRNVGDPLGAVELLTTHEPDPTTGAATAAFLALALRDLGRHDEALRISLSALAGTAPMYGRAILGYADELVAPRAADETRR